MGSVSLPCRKGLLTVHSRHTRTYAVRQLWVVSCQLAKSNITISCSTGFETELSFPVIKIFADAEFLIGGNRPKPGSTAQAKNGDPMAAAAS